MSELAHLNLFIDGTGLCADNSDVKKAVEFILASFGERDTVATEKPFALKKLAGGFANDIYCLSFKNGPPSVVFRIFRDAVASVVSREMEIEVHRLLAKHGLAADIVFKFQNGICYQFIDGEPLSLEWILQSFDNSLFVGEKMAALHNIDRSALQCRRNIAESFVWAKMNDYVCFLEHKVPDVFSDIRVKAAYGGPNELRELIEELRNNIERFRHHSACALALCHNDLLFNNMVFNCETRKFCFIDFEYADVNYCAFDIANLFCEFAGVDPIDSIDYGRYPSKEYQLKWIKHYLTHRHLVADAGNIDLLASEFYVIVQKLSMVSHLFWSLMVLIQSQVLVGVTYDYIGYGCRRLAELKRRKAEFLSLNFPL